MLIEAHGPERDHLALGVCVELGEFLQETSLTPESSDTFSSV
jgi:hypothetical protein